MGARIDLDRAEGLDGLVGRMVDSGLGIEKIMTNTELQTIKEFTGFAPPAADQ